MDFSIDLDSNSNVALYRRVCDAIRLAIAERRLQPGQYLPSQRELSDALGIGRNTVIKSYNELVNQGYLEIVGGIGTRVSIHRQRTAQGDGDAEQEHDGTSEILLSRYGQWLLDDNSMEKAPTACPELNWGTAPFDMLPLAQWQRIGAKYCRTQMPSIDDVDQPLGYFPLRQAVSNYARRAREVICDPNQVIVFNSTQHALNVMARVFVDPDDLVGVENPGFWEARQAFLSQRARLCPIAVDEKGIVVSELTRQPEPVRVVYVTPAHQDPTGATMSPDRRHDLLEWAKTNKSIIIEDDYDHEYRYGRPTPPALQSADRSSTVIYMFNFWKLLFPITTLHFVIVPKRLVQLFTRAKMLSQPTFALMEQVILTEFLNEGGLERHIRKSKGVFAKRRQTLLYTLARYLKDKVQIQKETAGMHVLVRFTVDLTEDKILQLAGQANLPMSGIGQCYLDREGELEFLIPFAHLKDDEIESSVQTLQRLLEEATR